MMVFVLLICFISEEVFPDEIMEFEIRIKACSPTFRQEAGCKRSRMGCTIRAALMRA